MEAIVCRSHIMEIHQKNLDYNPFRKSRSALQRALRRSYKLNSTGDITMATNVHESTQGETANVTNTKTTFMQ